MDFKQFESKYPKLARRINHHLPCLNNGENYIVPTTVGAFKELDFFSHHLDVNGVLLYFKPNSSKALTDIVSGIYEVNEIKDLHSFNIVYHTIISAIEDIFLKGTELELQPLIKSILEQLRKKRKEYTFYYIVEGIELVDIDRLQFGNTTISRFEALFEYFNSKYDGEEFFEKHARSFIEHNFQKSLIIHGATFGDEEKAKELFHYQCGITLSALRLMACIFYKAGYSKQRLSIDLRSRRFVDSDQYIRETRSETRGLLFGHGATEPQNMPITQELQSRLDNLLFPELVALHLKDRMTDIESAIVNSLYWIGEAQNDLNVDNSFIKYWISLESFFSFQKEDLTENIAIGISTILSYGGSTIRSPQDLMATYKYIKTLYDKRSKIVHRGARNRVSLLELSDISSFACWITISVLSFIIHRGYKTLKQLNEQSHRIYASHS